MIVQLILHPEELYESVHELVRMAFSGSDVHRGAEFGGDVKVFIERRITGEKVFLQGLVEGPGMDCQHQENICCPFQGDEGRRQLSRLTRRFAYDLLALALKKDLNAYGILTGMRPVKLVHRLLDQGEGPEAIQIRLQDEFRMQEAKARLLLEVALNNRATVNDGRDNDRSLSLYIGVPFCPSRCYYCSFTGAVLKDYERELRPFLRALTTEMKSIAPVLKEIDLCVQTIYLGGGTPTVLSERDLADLFAVLHEHYIGPNTEEITVEAGRPDTLTPGKLKLLYEMGVNRVCINPQTMNAPTLKAIGRDHDVEGVMRSLEWAREAGIKNINMDLIVGLPGEGLEENQHTAQQVLRLGPENVTVHTLAVKRGSTLAQKEGLSLLRDREKEVEEGVNFFAQILGKSGYLPYYLYRQKYIKASMENIGYARPGSFSTYNIKIMEECQTLLGLGGGAGSKFFNWKNGSLASFYNPKNPVSYNESLDRLISAKVDKLRGLH